MACTAINDIPLSMLPEADSEIVQTEAIGTLQAYAFISEQQQLLHFQDRQNQARSIKRTFDVHPLVHLAMGGWLKAHCQWNTWVERSMLQLSQLVPFGDHETRDIWTA